MAPKGAKVPRWHRFNLIPTRDVVGLARGQEYEDKMICWTIANGDVSTYESLYWERPAYDVFELYGLHKAGTFVSND